MYSTKRMSQEVNDTQGFFHMMKDVGIGYDTEICQYLNVEYLIGILKNNSYYVKRKESFKDKREKEFPLFMQFPLSPSNEEDKRLLVQSEQQKEEWYRDNKEYEELSHLLTACWTVRTNENILMWDRGNPCKACIQSTIGDFVSSFDSNMAFTIWCGRILYSLFSMATQPSQKLWIKEPFFSDEDEVRFYFSANFDKIEPDVPSNNDLDGISLKVNPIKMIHHITLSPYINYECAKILKAYFSKEYQISTSFSRIDLQHNK